MQRFWNIISLADFNLFRKRPDSRHVILCNRISAILSLFTLLTFFVALGYFGWLLSVKLALIASIIFLTPLVLNQFSFFNASRLFLCFSISLVTVIISVADKTDVPVMLEEFQYFEFRLILLVSCLFPFMLFRLDERKSWMSLFTINFLFIALYDPIHELFNVGYYQQGFTAPNYYFLNYMVIATFFMLSGSTYFLKYSFEKYERSNELLIVDLHDANKVIRQQRELLAQENKQLNHDLVETNKQLTETNQELIRHNNDLLQFSYTVSHNVRGPLASLMGLINLLQKEHPSEHERNIIHHVNKSLSSLNSIIHDLSSIIDIRNAIVQVKQKIDFTDEISVIQSLLVKQIQDQRVVIETNFSEAPEIVSVKAMVSSILYNLISNAIKYRSSERAPKISVTSSYVDNYIRIIVADNGLGIDLDRFRENLFGLYKRFHTHTEGKGLGLFLVKLQSEALGGRVEVSSTLGEGTTFTIYLATSSTEVEQILLDSSTVKIIFHTDKNYIISQWKRPATVDEFQEASNQISDFMKNYRIPNWIIDISKSQNESGLNEVHKDFHQKLKTYGTQRIAFVVSRQEMAETAYVIRKEIIDSYPLPVAFFDNIVGAGSWIQSENEKCKILND
jgi:signal transduction histidine kinase